MNKSIEKEFLDWIVKFIKNDALLGSWIEERKYELVKPLVKSLLNIDKSSKTIIIITSNKYKWFKEYILMQTNLDGIQYIDLECFNKTHENLSDDYVIWYYGDNQDESYKIAKELGITFWCNITTIECGEDDLSLNEKAESFPMKLLQVFRLFHKVIVQRNEIYNKFAIGNLDKELNMVKVNDLKFEQIETLDKLKDIELQFEVNLQEYINSMPNVYIVYKDTKSISIVSKRLLTPIGLSYTLTHDDIWSIHMFQKLSV